MSTTTIATTLVWTCVICLTVSLLVFAWMAAPVLLRDLHAWLTADRSWRASALSTNRLPIAEREWSAEVWAEIDEALAADDHTFEVVEAWREDGAA